MYETGAQSMFEDFEIDQRKDQKRRMETKRELQSLLTKYLGREGIKFQCIQAEKERQVLCDKTETTQSELFHMQ